jgi:MFS family permease
VLRGLSPAYKRYLAVVLLFGLGNSSDAFLILRAEQDMGVTADRLLLLYALFNVVEAALGYAAGRHSDRVGRRPLLAAGWVVFAVVYLGFALLGGAGPWAAVVLFLLYGAYATLTGGVQKAMAADFAHPDRRGAEMGVFHLLVGVAALPASLLAGVLFRNVSHAAPFYVGAATALLAALLLPRRSEATTE